MDRETGEENSAKVLGEMFLCAAGRREGRVQLVLLLHKMRAWIFFSFFFFRTHPREIR